MADQKDSSGEDFATLFEQSEKGGSVAAGAQSRSAGDLVVGTIVSISAEAAFVDLGGKSEGVLDLDQITDEEGRLTVSVGDDIEAHIVDAGERSGSIRLRRTLGRGPQARDELHLAFEQEIPVEGVVTGVNKGGFEVQIAGGQAFCPVSQMDLRFVDDPEMFIGQRHQFRITRYEQGRGSGDNLVISRRILLEEKAEVEAAGTRARLEVGAVFAGTVTRIENYGAFVDIGGIEGLLHISELAYGRVEHPGEVVAVDQALDVQVVKIEVTDDPRRPEKIGLSIRSLARDPWDDVSKHVSVGEKMTGTVRRIEAFGAFVEVLPGLEGLVHISEMGGSERISSPRKIVEVGQSISVSVLSVDAEKRRIALSMNASSRATQVAEEQEAIAKYAPSKQGFGTFADLLKQQTDKK